VIVSGRHEDDIETIFLSLRIAFFS